MGQVADRKIRGSSPRMRGARGHRCERAGSAGIIPADAGSTIDPLETAYRQQGSSPRMRGAPNITSCQNRRCGIIPADAGSTLS